MSKHRNQHQQLKPQAQPVAVVAQPTPQLLEAAAATDVPHPAPVAAPSIEAAHAQPEVRRERFLEITAVRETGLHRAGHFFLHRMPQLVRYAELTDEQLDQLHRDYAAKLISVRAIER